MVHFILPLLTAVACVVLPVYGGNRAWESSIKFTRAKRPSDFSLSKEDNAVAQPSIRPDKERYYAMKPSENDADPFRWPNGVVKYCFSGFRLAQKDLKTARSLLSRHLNTAINVWYSQGLPESFQWIEGSKEDCEGEVKSGYLTIVYDTEGLLRSSVGIHPDDIFGPSMRLSDSSEIGMLNVVANIVHEMGHVWGLHHEHQNPAFWDRPYSEAGGTIFKEFNCKNLKDYDEIERRFHSTDMPKDKIKQEMRAICTSQAAAASYQFSAQEYLPSVGTSNLADSERGIDWESIMLYPSGAGGKGSASSPIDDDRLPILLRPGGSRIPINVLPSARDVQGIKRLYKYDPRSTWIPLGDKRNKLKGTFDKSRRADPGNRCG